MATQTTIPILNLTRQYETLKSQIDSALVRVAASGHYILGPEVQAFEREMAEYLGVKHVIGCASGTDALYLALKALKIGAGDEVITTPFSYVATSEAIAHTGAKPVFVDILPDTMNMDPALLAAAITPKTKAILPVHIFGQPADMDAIRDIAKTNNLPVVEDCAQAINAAYPQGGQLPKTGALGEIGCFSFFPSKNLGALGDGGMCSTNDDNLADRLRMLRVHGSRQRYYHEEPGLNSRLDEIQAAVLRVKLPHLDEWTQARNAVADYYDELLAPHAQWVKTPVRQVGVRHAFHQYTLQLQPFASESGPDRNEALSQRREKLRDELQAAGIQVMVYYPLPLYRQGTHANLNLNPVDYPVCESVSAQVFSLPMFPELRRDEQQQVVDSLLQALKKSCE